MRPRIMLYPRSTRRRPAKAYCADLELGRTEAKRSVAREAVAVAERFLDLLDARMEGGHGE